MGHYLRQELQRNKAMQAGVLGLLNNPHPPAANSFDDVVVGDGLANQWVGGRHGPVILGW